MWVERNKSYLFLNKLHFIGKVKALHFYGLKMVKTSYFCRYYWFNHQWVKLETNGKKVKIYNFGTFQYFGHNLSSIHWIEMILEAIYSYDIALCFCKLSQSDSQVFLPKMPKYRQEILLSKAISGWLDRL